MIPCKECIVLARCIPKEEIKCDLIAKYIVDGKSNRITFSYRKRTIRKRLPNCTTIYTNEGRNIDDFLLKLSLGPWHDEDAYLKYKETTKWNTHVKIV